MSRTLILTLLLAFLVSCSDKTEWIEPYTSSSSSEIVSSSSEEVSSSSSEEMQSSSSVEDNSSSSSVSYCGNEIYNPDTHFCFSGDNTAYLLCGAGKNEYNVINQRCGVGGIVEELCGTNWYNTEINFCQSGDIKPLCGGQPYAINQKCENNTVMTPCGTSGLLYFDSETHFCYNSSTVHEKCGGSVEYNPTNQRCEANIVETRCGTGDVFRNPEIEECCANSKYTTATQFCASDYEVYNKCGGEEYEPTTHGCCLNVTYVNSNQRCLNNIVETKCGSGNDFDFYNPITQFCSGNNIYDLCGGAQYNPLIKFCASDNNVYDKCGESTYEPTNQRCGEGNIVETKCGTSWYNGITQFCDGNYIVSKCGSSIYSASQKCIDGALVDLSVVTIGSQIWMAENLNYAVEGSKCYGEDGRVHTGEVDNALTFGEIEDDEVQENCETYGRLYDWVTAKTICPDGWHLPENNEWEELMLYVGGTKIDTTNGVTIHFSGINDNLKATSSDWQTSNGTNSSGFTALPGGFWNAGITAFSRINLSGYWHSATEFSTGNAYMYYIWHNNSYSTIENRSKTNLQSVRCVMD